MHEEDNDHLFKECTWAQQVWFSSHLSICFAKHDLGFTDLLEYIIIHAPPDVVEHVLALCYEIWGARNKLALF